MSEWIPVRTCLPPEDDYESGDRTKYLVYLPGHGIHFGTRLPEVLGTFRPIGFFGYDKSVTHWMPLPDPPDTEDDISALGGGE